MKTNRQVFDLLTTCFKNQQQAYGDIEDMFGSTGEIPVLIDDTLARLEQVIMINLGWKLHSIKNNDLALDGDMWVKGEMMISEDNLAEWFSIFNVSTEYSDRMNILFEMSIGDAFAYERFNELIAEDSSLF